jgi:hypothetical protein
MTFSIECIYLFIKYLYFYTLDFTNQSMHHSFNDIIIIFIIIIII